MGEQTTPQPYCGPNETQRLVTQLELTGAKLCPFTTSMAWDCLHSLHALLLLLTP